jgi:hypothetical protein
MTISELLNNRNVNGDIYLSDVDKWLGHEAPIEKVRELRDKLMELINGKDN